MPLTHAVVWLDHTAAHVLHFTREEVEKSLIHGKDPHTRLHAKHTTHEIRPLDCVYHRDIAAALDGAREILVCGPGTAKLEFLRYLHKHDHATEQRVVAVESVDHPSDGQLLSYARKSFRAIDNMI